MRNPPCAWYKYNIRTDCLLAAPFRATSSMRPTAGILEADNSHHAPLSSAIAKTVLEEVKGRADLV